VGGYLGEGVQGAPVVRIYEQRDDTHATLAMEHYPPGGVGIPVAMQFTTKGPCLRIQAKRRNPKNDPQAAGLVLVSYYLILDSKALHDVGEALVNDLPPDSENLATKPNDLRPPDSEKLTKPYAYFPKYWGAIKNKCGEKD